MSDRFFRELWDETYKKYVLDSLENNEEICQFFNSSDVKKTCKFTLQSKEVPSLRVLVIATGNEETERLETFLLGEDGNMLSNYSCSRRLGYVTNDGLYEDTCVHDSIESLVKHLMEIKEIEVNFYELGKFVGLESVRDLFTESDNESQEEPKKASGPNNGDIKTVAMMVNGKWTKVRKVYLDGEWLIIDED